MFVNFTFCYYYKKVLYNIVTRKIYKIKLNNEKRTVDGYNG